MKNILLVFACLLFLLPFVYGQGKIAQITNQRYDGDSAVWITTNTQNWEYDAADREVVYITWNIYQGAYAPTNNRRLETVYHPNGKIDFQKDSAWGDTIWTLTETTYKYNLDDKLEEIIYKNEGSGSEIISYQRESYEEDLLNNHRVKKNYYTTESPTNWQIQYQRDSFFDENSCLEKTTIVNYDEVGETTTERWFVDELDEDCYVLQSGYWLRDVVADTMFLSSRHRFLYSNDYKTKTDIYERKSQQTDEWEAKHLVEKTVDEAGRELRYFYEIYKHSYTDTVLKVTTYTEQGEIATFKEFKTAYQFNDQPLYPVRLDSFVYQYDDAEKLLEKTQFIQHYDNLPRKLTTRYNYYCNRQLRAETFEELPSVSRILYEYYGNTDCFLLETEEPKLSIFPNPSKGNFTLKSNLLATLGARIDLYSITGQLVFSQKVNRITDNFQVAITDLAKGSYILTVQNEKDIISEKIVIF